jgi:hypothetical protein
MTSESEAHREGDEVLGMNIIQDGMEPRFDEGVQRSHCRTPPRAPIEAEKGFGAMIITTLVTAVILFGIVESYPPD